MNYQLDQLGKYFTEHIHKQLVPIMALVQGTVVSGNMHLLPNNRVKDELNNGERFIAITEAQVHDVQSCALLYEGAVLLLNKDHITWLIPKEQKDDSEPQS